MKRISLVLTAVAFVASAVPAGAGTVASCGGFAPEVETCSVTFTHPGGALTISVVLGPVYVGRVDYTLESATGSRVGGCFWTQASELTVSSCPSPSEERTGTFHARQRLTLTAETSFAAGEWEVRVIGP